MIGEEIHYDDQLLNSFTTETSEKTKFFEIDIVGFNKFIKGYLQSRYGKIISFFNSVGSYLKETRSDFNSFIRLVQLMNTRKVLNNTLIVK